jgi:hypothetical protein
VIKDIITRYFKKLITKTTLRHPILDGLEFHCLDSVEADWLERPFQEEEVLQALLNIDGDKAPRPNDFYCFFFFPDLVGDSFITSMGIGCLR